jgi:uncharacterized protein
MRFLREAGYSTLAVDFQAHGESTGDLITLGRLESLDARLALACMRARLPGEPVAVLGVSMGGSAALIGPPIDADAVIVESGGPSFADGVSNRLTLAIGPIGRLLAPFMLGAMRIAAGSDASTLRPIDGIVRLHKPIFVMTGADDQKTRLPRRANHSPQPIRRSATGKRPGAQHWDLSFAGGPAYRERLLDFLDSTLRSTPPRLFAPDWDPNTRSRLTGSNWRARQDSNLWPLPSEDKGQRFPRVRQPPPLYH